MLAADAPHDRGDAGVLQVELVPGQAMGDGEGRQPAAQGAGLQGGGHVGQVAADRRRGCGQGRQALSRAPGGEVGPVAAVALAGRGGASGAGIAGGAGEGGVVAGDEAVRGGRDETDGDHLGPLWLPITFTYRKPGCSVNPGMEHIDIRTVLEV